MPAPIPPRTAPPRQTQGFGACPGNSCAPLTHPVSGAEISLSSPLPADLAQRLDALRDR